MLKESNKSFCCFCSKLGNFANDSLVQTLKLCCPLVQGIVSGSSSGFSIKFQNLVDLVYSPVHSAVETFGIMCEDTTSYDSRTRENGCVQCKL